MLIAIEGVDKSGKETQANLLLDRLRREGKNARKVEFPNYRSEASTTVRMYLNGDFGKTPDDVNPYAASLFFAIDRYASYKMEWSSFYNAGGIVIADRYTMSNMIHQGAKFSDALERQNYIDWLIDLEFIKIGLPEPNIVIFLDLSMELRILLMEKNGAEVLAEPPSPASTVTIAGTVATTASAASSLEAAAAATATAATAPEVRPHKRATDIHEQDLGYLRRAHICAREVAAQLDWKRIDAGRGGALRPSLDIHEELYSKVAPFI